MAGFGLGDEGKGSVVDHLVREHGADLVVRYNGGAQAAHHVVLGSGATHCFSQFGSGTLVDGVRTHLSASMVVDPPALAAEQRALQRHGVRDAYARLSIAPRALIVTPYHQALNCARELARGSRRHGSCGRGIAEARLDSETAGVASLRAEDLLDLSRLRARLELIALSKIDIVEQLVDRHAGRPELSELARQVRRIAPAELAERYHRLFGSSGLRVGDPPVSDRPLVLEGAQGVLLDRHRGFWPHVTPSRTTFAPALAWLAERAAIDPGQTRRIGVTRAYATRHGAGPLVSEDAQLCRELPEPHNADHPWQGSFRAGWLDLVALDYAARISGGADELAVTNLDRLLGLGRLQLCTAYRSPDGGQLERIEPPPADDLAARAALTDRLSGCRPCTEELDPLREPGEPAVDRLLERIEQACRAPVTLCSWGPTAGDKHLR